MTFEEAREELRKLVDESQFKGKPFQFEIADGRRHNGTEYREYTFWISDSDVHCWTGSLDRLIALVGAQLREELTGVEELGEI